MSRKDQGKRTRDDILNTAVRLFSQQGYHQTSTADILEAVSISKGAFYHHFNSKQDLAMAVLDQMRADYRSEFFEPVRQQTSVGNSFTDALDRIVSLNASSQWHYCRLLARLIHESTFGDEVVIEQIKQVTEELLNFWIQAIADDQAAGTINPSLNSQHTAQLTVAMIHGLLGWAELSDQPQLLRATADQLILLTRKGESSDSI